MTHPIIPPHLRPFIANADPLATLSRLITNTRGFVYRRRHDPAWTMDFVSDGCRDVTGYDPHRFVANPSLFFADLIHAADRDRVDAEVAAAVEDHRRRTLRYRIRTAYEKVVRVEDRLLPVYNPDGKLAAIEGVIDFAKDDPVAVDEHTGWAEAFADAFRRSPVPLVLSRANGTLGAINAACVRHFELPTDALLETDRLPDLLRRLAAHAGKDVAEHDYDGGKALGAVSVPVASPLGPDTIVTAFPREEALRSTLWWRGAARRVARRMRRTPRRRCGAASDVGGGPDAERSTVRSHAKTRRLQRRPVRGRHRGPADAAGSPRSIRPAARGAPIKASVRRGSAVGSHHISSSN